MDRRNWNYTYDELDSQIKQRYTRDEYVQKNRYLDGVDQLAQSSPEVPVLVAGRRHLTAGRPLRRVRAGQTGRLVEGRRRGVLAHGESA
ncbi:MAG: hypothetical protein AVDCRST_MAG78-2980 [uncultured Rubrobacteraceae bacterium]|uniref:Uncharacterized protein n=1 Tax=uncultured Rubrobacteraceae bacterium TaxID=349277 RepID=A0A6J4QTL6_9ACTN|nr:MAG: hypothetical protein AVDCRST_MAG78-2980 [uncultured Rubrobacteraceae bacterium]